MSTATPAPSTESGASTATPTRKKRRPLRIVLFVLLSIVILVVGVFVAAVITGVKDASRKVVVGNCLDGNGKGATDVLSVVDCKDSEAASVVLARIDNVDQKQAELNNCDKIKDATAVYWTKGRFSSDKGTLLCLKPA